MSAGGPTRDELAERYLAQLPYAPYPVQEEALLTWFKQGRTREESCYGLVRSSTSRQAMQQILR